MRELQDKYVDDCIVRALKNENTVTLQQQQRAWEKLRCNAAKQTILPPLADPIHVRIWKSARLWSKTHLSGIYRFFLDDSAYRRAQQRYPTLVCHRRPQSMLFSSSEFMLSV